MKKIFLSIILVASFLNAKQIKWSCKIPRINSPIITKEIVPRPIIIIYDNLKDNALIIERSNRADALVQKHKNGNYTFVTTSKMIMGKGEIVMMITILKSGIVVVSKHNVFSDKVIPFQLYGKCKLIKK